MHIQLHIWHVPDVLLHRRYRCVFHEQELSHQDSPRTSPVLPAQKHLLNWLCLPAAGRQSSLSNDVGHPLGYRWQKHVAFHSIPQCLLQEHNSRSASWRHRAGRTTYPDSMLSNPHSSATPMRKYGFLLSHNRWVKENSWSTTCQNVSYLLLLSSTFLLPACPYRWTYRRRHRLSDRDSQTKSLWQMPSHHRCHASYARKRQRHVPTFQDNPSDIRSAGHPYVLYSL